MIMLLLVACGQAATRSQTRSAMVVNELSVLSREFQMGGTQGVMSGDDLVTGQGVMLRDDPVLCRADPISCSATPVELDCRRWTTAAGGAPSACLQDVYSAILYWLLHRDMAPLSRLLAVGHSPDVRMVINGQMFVTPLMLASMLAEFDLMLVLLEYGAEVSLTDANGASALTYTCGRYFLAGVASPTWAIDTMNAMVSILVDFGAELGEEPRAGVLASWSAYHELVAAAKDGLDGPNRHLIKPGAAAAARHGHSAVLRRLLERGMSLDARDDDRLDGDDRLDDGSTLLMMASFDSQVKIVQVRANPHPNPHPNLTLTPTLTLTSPDPNPDPDPITSSCSAAVPTRRSLTTTVAPP